MYIVNNTDWLGVRPGQPSILDKVPVGVYKVACDMEHGFMLVPSESEQSIRGEKSEMIGSMAGKERKVIDAYRRRSTSTGVLLSGDRGLGKTMLLRKIARLSLTELEIPVIIVSANYSGLAEFLGTINQEYMLVLDELEKVVDDKHDQEMLLTVLDGVCSYKRLVVATCNNVNHLSRHMLGRPNRFYYHLEFDYPNLEESLQFLRSRGAEIDDARAAALQAETILHPFNYDILAALAAELVAGYPLGESLDDLNDAQDKDGQVYVDVEMVLDGGVCYSGTRCVSVNIFDMTAPRYDRRFTVQVYSRSGVPCLNNAVCFEVRGLQDGKFVLDVCEYGTLNVVAVSSDMEKDAKGALRTYRGEDDEDDMVKVLSAFATVRQDMWSLHGRVCG